MIEVLNFLIPSILSLVALYFSISSFKRDQTFHNENSLYEAKLEAYRAIIRLTIHYLSEIEDILQPLINYHNNPDQELLDDLSKKEDLANQLTYKLKNELTEYRFLASPSVDEKLDIFIEYLLNGDPYFETFQQYIDYSKNAIDVLYQQAEEIAKVMHEEMKIAPLNEQLFKRLTKKTSRFAFSKPS